MENRDELDEMVDSTENSDRETGNLPAGEGGEAPEEENKHGEGNDALDIIGNILGAIIKTVGALALAGVVFVALGFGACILLSLFF